MSALRLPLCMTFFPIINKGKPGKFYPIFPHLVVGKKRLQDSLEQMSDLTVRKTDFLELKALLFEMSLLDGMSLELIFQRAKCLTILSTVSFVSG